MVERATLDSSVDVVKNLRELFCRIILIQSVKTVPIHIIVVAMLMNLKFALPSIVYLKSASNAAD